MILPIRVLNLGDDAGFVFRKRKKAEEKFKMHADNFWKIIISDEIQKSKAHPYQKIHSHSKLLTGYLLL